MSLSPGTRLGPSEIVGVIGQGGMGEVYRARDARLDRFVARRKYGCSDLCHPTTGDDFECR